MMSETSNHLSEKALNDVLIGLATAASDAHLARCAQCRARVEEFQADISLFNQASLAWSETQPVRTLAAVRPLGTARRRLVLAAWAAAAVMFLMAGAPFLRNPVQRRAPASEPEIADSEAQIAQDNELLRAVNAAINPDEQSAINGYRLLESRAPKAHPKTRKQ